MESTFLNLCRCHVSVYLCIALSLQAMNIEEEILDLPEDKKEGKDFKWLRIIALLFFMLALFFRFNKWAGQAAFLMLGVATFCFWAVMKFIYTPIKYIFDWLFLFGRVGLVLGLLFRFLYDFAFSTYLVYVSIVILMIGLFLQSRVNAEN